MPDLIAQGPEPQYRWRRPLRAGESFVLGRDAGAWSAEWDDRISRKHAQLVWRSGRLRVQQLPTARNPIFVQGREAANFDIAPGEHFVIGRTTFTVLDEQVSISLQAPSPVEEQTFSSQYLRRISYHDADRRLEVLGRLPDLISGAANDDELCVRLVNLLLAGIPRASAVAVVALEKPHAVKLIPEKLAGEKAVPDTLAQEKAAREKLAREKGTGEKGTGENLARLGAVGAEPPAVVQLLHWDRRLAIGGDFQPSRRLIVEAIQRREGVLHVWGGRAASGGPEFTLRDNSDWAFCTPVPGDASAGWGIYVAGSLGTESPAARAPDTGDIREDLKFTELVASTLSALRQVRLLERRQVALSQFFAPAVLEAMEAKDPNQVLAPRETEVSVLFCDLRGFSQEAVRRSANLMDLLQRTSKALGVMTHHILDQGGVVGDFHGDAAMGFWGWPFSQPDSVQRACLAALAIRSHFEAAAARPGHLLADFRMGLGLATGRAVAGRIGTTDQVKVTVFGPVVNLASRLENMTKILRTPILIDDVTAKHVKTQLSPKLARCRRLAVVKPFGIDFPVEVAELLPPADEYPELSDEHLAAYERALDAFLKGNWPESLELLHLVPPKDRVKDFLTVFIAQHNRTPPPNWDGVVPLTSKG